MTARSPLPPTLTAQRLADLAQRVVASPEAPRRDLVAPFAGEAVASYPLSTVDDVRVAAESARDAQRAWAARPLAERRRVLLRLHDIALARQDEIVDVVQLETGKARIHAFEEVVDVALNSRYYARRAHALLRPRRRVGFVPALTGVTELRHPKGVVGVIAPWNFPIVMALCDVLPALVAGNAVVVKPDQQTTFSALLAAELLEQAGLPEGLYQVVAGSGPTLGPALVDVVDYVAFTGSTATGRSVAVRAAERLVGVSLELGGKNAGIVLPDADLDRTVDGLIHGTLSSSGQLCVSLERLFVHEQVYDDLLARWVSRLEGLAVGPGYEYTAEMGSLTGSAQLERVARHVDDAVAKGATVLTGGRPLPHLGPYFYAPTLLADVTPAMDVYGTETFGPVVSVYRFSDGDDVVAHVNDTPFGLNASVFSGNPSQARALAARIQAGTVNVNEGYAAAWGSIDAPMGGMKDSGMSRRHGAEGLLKFTEVQTVATARLATYATVPFLSQSAYARTATTLLRVMKATRRR